MYKKMGTENNNQLAAKEDILKLKRKSQKYPLILSNKCLRWDKVTTLAKIISIKKSWPDVIVGSEPSKNIVACKLFQLFFSPW